MYVHVFTYIFYLYPLRKPRRNDNPAAVTTGILISKHHERNRSPLEEWLILSLRQGQFKMSLEYLVVQKSEDKLKTDGDMSREQKSHFEGAPIGQIWDNSRMK